MKVPVDDNQGTVRVAVTEEGTPAEVHERGVSQVLVAKDQGRNPAMAYIDATKSNDKNAMLNTWTETTVQDRKNMIEGQLDYLPSSSIHGQMVEMEEDLAGPVDLGNYKQTIRSMPSSLDKTREEVTREAVHMQNREIMADVMPDTSEMDFSEIAANIGGTVIPKRKGYTLMKLMDDMGFSEGVLDSAVVLADPTTPIMKLRNVYWSLDDEGKAEFSKVFADNIHNASDNDFIKAEITENIFGADFAPGLDRAFELLDTVDIVGLSAGVVKLANGIRKSGKILNTPRRLKEADLEAEMIEDAVQNPEAARQVGVTPAEVGDRLNPLVHGESGNLLVGASEDQASAVTAMMNKQEAVFTANVDTMNRQGVLDAGEIQEAMARAEDKLLDDPNIIDASVAQIDDSGFKLSYTEAYFDKAGKVRQRNHEKVVDFKVNDIGELKAPLDEWTGNFLAMDPNARMSGKLRQWFVSDVEKMGRMQEKTAKALDNMLRIAFQPLNKKSAANVDHALRQGAKAAKDYNYDELRNGVTGRDLSHKEASAYLGARNVVGKLYDMKNQQLVDGYLADGVKLWDGPEGALPVRQYDDVHSARTAWQQVDADSHHVLIPERGLTLGGQTFDNGLMPFKKRDLSKEMLAEAYSKGYVLARNNNSQSMFRLGQAKTQWALIKSKHVHSPRGQQVLHRIPGYMPKQRTEGFWFIKKSKASGLSGASNHRVLSTSAFSDSHEAAQKWVAKQDNPDEFEIVFDREMTSDQRAYDVASTHGGMYSGSRKAEELEYVGQSDPKFADSFEAFQHYINHIGRQYPASLYRLGSEHRLVKIANGLGISARNLNMHNVLEEAAKKLDKSSKEYKMLKDIHDQLAFVNMIPTDAERAMAHRIRTIGQMIDNDIPILRKAPKLFYKAAAKNVQPQDFIRGLTFNHLLGMWNPAQLLVQFSGSLISAAIDPMGYPKHIAKGIGWATLDQIVSDPIKQGKVLDWMKSKGLNDYVENYELWRKSGYFESVTQGNADYTSVLWKNMPYDAGVLKKVLANHTYFYKAGELANTRVAFSTAIDRYKKVHGVSKINPNNQVALDEVSLWAEKYRLNMGRANQSNLNKGLLAVPMQFQQVISKYYEKVMPQVLGGTDEFTTAQKIRLGAIPTVATGMAGVPFGQDLVVGFLDMLGMDESELSEADAALLKWGMIGYGSNIALDLNVNFADRMQLGGDVLRNSWEGLMNGKATWEWLGASGTVADRYMRNLGYMSKAMTLIPGDGDNFNTTDELTAAASVILDIAADIPTVSRNFKQYSAHLFANNPRYVKDGKYMWEWEQMNTQTAFFAAAGFQPSEMSEMYEISNEIRGDANAISTFGDTDADVIVRLMNTKLLDAKNGQQADFYARIVNNMLHRYGPIEQQKLLETIFNKMHTKQMDQNNLMYRTLMFSMEKQQEGLDLLNTLYNRKIQEQK